MNEDKQWYELGAKELHSHKGQWLKGQHAMVLSSGYLEKHCVLVEIQMLNLQDGSQVG